MTTEQIGQAMYDIGFANGPRFAAMSGSVPNFDDRDEMNEHLRRGNEAWEQLGPLPENP